LRPSEKYREYGGGTSQNKEYVEGIIISPLGARILYDEIQKKSRFNTKYISFYRERNICKKPSGPPK
jgi:hypothetical protein